MVWLDYLNHIKCVSRSTTVQGYNSLHIYNLLHYTALHTIIHTLSINEYNFLFKHKLFLCFVVFLLLGLNFFVFLLCFLPKNKYIMA